MRLKISSDIVMGLRWSRAPERELLTAKASNLDAICVLADGHGHRLEVIHPGQPKSANGSVIHTGDSRTGASEWDDERIFVFLNSLPRHVERVVLGVVSRDRPFSEVAEASCHVSDSWREIELLRIDLTSLGRITEYCVATVERSARGWIMRRAIPDDARLQVAA